MFAIASPPAHGTAAIFRPRHPEDRSHGDSSSTVGMVLFVVVLWHLRKQVTLSVQLIERTELPGRGGGLDCGRYVTAVVNKRHGGQDRTPQIDGGEVEGEDRTAAVAHGDV